MSKVNLGNNYALGIKSTDETKQKLSIFAKTRTGNKNPFYGKSLSNEVRKKISEKNKNKSPSIISNIIIDDINYESLTQASNKLKIPVSTISWRIRSKNPKFDSYKYNDKGVIKLPLFTKICINNTEYNSIKEASKKLNFTYGYIKKRIESTNDNDINWNILNKYRDKRKQIGKKVMINDIIYDSIKEASERLNISEQIIAKRLNSKEPIPVTSKKRINIDGNIYDSITEASRKLNININTIVRRLRNNNFKNYTYLPIEYIDLSKYKYV